MTQHSCQIDDRGSSLLSYCPTRKSGSQRSHHCEPGSFRTFFISESFQGLSPKVSPKLNTLSPPKSPPRFWASPPTFLESPDCKVMFGSFKDALHDHGVLSTPEIYHSGLSLTPHFSKAPLLLGSRFCLHFRNSPLSKTFSQCFQIIHEIFFILHCCGCRAAKISSTAN